MNDGRIKAALKTKSACSIASALPAAPAAFDRNGRSGRPEQAA